MQSNAHQHQPLQPGLPRAANEDEWMPPGSPRAADENEQLPPGPPGTADKDEQLPPGPPGTADEDEWPPAASPGIPHERLQLPPASQGASTEMQGGKQHRRRKNGGVTADSPSSKHRKVDHQVDGAAFSRRRSNQDRHLTAKAIEER